MKVLCIDGGGIRGLIPALVLAEIERRTGRRIARAGRPRRRHVDGRDPRVRADPPRRRRPAAATQRGGARRHLRRGGPEDLPPQPAQADLLRRGLDRRALRRRRAQRRARALPGRARLSGALARRARDRVRHPRPLRVLLPLRARTRATRRTTSRSSRSRARPSAAPSYFEPAEATDVAGARTYPLIDGGVYAVNPVDVRVRRRRRAPAAPTSSS